MTFGNAISACFGKYATFSGRASRSEFWWFYLFATLMMWGATIAGGALGGETNANIAGNVVSLAFFIPILAAGSRRLHDTGRSGWWQLLIITIIGIIVLIIFWAADSKMEDNKYGSVPEDRVNA